MLALLLLPLLAAQVPSPAPGAVVCRSIGLETARVWTFEPVDDTWRVAHHVEGTSRRAVLVLPNARAAFTADAVSLRSRTANGGIDVTLTGARNKATLDAYVNYELEVNVDASLTPEMDEIDTDGPVGVSCQGGAPDEAQLEVRARRDVTAAGSKPAGGHGLPPSLKLRRDK